MPDHWNDLECIFPRGCVDMGCIYFHVVVLTWDAYISTRLCWHGMHIFPRGCVDMECIYFHVVVLTWDAYISTRLCWHGMHIFPRGCVDMECIYFHVVVLTWDAYISTRLCWHGMHIFPRGCVDLGCIYFHEVVIPAPVDRVFITDQNTTTFEPSRQANLFFSENHSGILRCVALGGSPPPDIDVYLGHQDITSRFVLSRSPTLTRKKGLRLVYYTTERSARQFLALPEDDGKLLRCVVSVPGSPSNETVARISVHCKSGFCLSNERYRMSIASNIDYYHLSLITHYHSWLLAFLGGGIQPNRT